MKVKQAKEILEEYLDDSPIFTAILTREEADEHIKNLYGEENTAELTDAEWANVVDLLGVDDAIWREIYNAFEYYLEATIKKRKEANVSSE